MKIRIGVGVGSAMVSENDLASVVRHIEGRGFDSMWVAESLTDDTFEPLTALALCAGVTSTLKLGTTFVLPGRNPARLAGELATLDQLSQGRLLLTAVLGLPDPSELAAQGVAAADRGPIMDEVVPLLRRFWSGSPVDHDGERYHYEGLCVGPLPHQNPLELWLGGMAPSALERAGLISDGWMPSGCTIVDAAAAKATVEAAAAAVGRTIDREHFGLSIAYSRRPLDGPTAERLQRRRPGIDLSSVVPIGLGSLRTTLEEAIGAGFSKFVLRPLTSATGWRAEVDALAAAVKDLQTS